MAVAIALLSTIPILFDIYRTAAFNTIPRDDYAPYLMALSGDGGSVPGAPAVYRVLSVAVALPIYWLTAPYRFTNLPFADPQYLRATQALSIVSYLSMLATAFAVYRLCAAKYGMRPPVSMVAGLMSLLLGGFQLRTGVDPFGVLVVTLLLLCVSRMSLFAPLMMLSAIVNEKIPILFSVVLFFRFLPSARHGGSRAMRSQLACAVAALCLYVGIVTVMHIPGVPSQTDPARVGANVKAAVVASLSAKGCVTNLLPLVTVCLMVMLAARVNKMSAYSPTDASGAIALTVLACLVNVQYNIGRIVMYSFPFYLPAAASCLEDLLNGERARAGGTAPPHR